MSIGSSTRRRFEQHQGRLSVKESLNVATKTEMKNQYLMQLAEAQERAMAEQARLIRQLRLIIGVAVVVSVLVSLVTALAYMPG